MIGSSISIRHPPSSLGMSSYLGCLRCHQKEEKLYLFTRTNPLKGLVIEGYLYKGEHLSQKFPSNKIKGGLQGEISHQKLITLINEVGQNCFMLNNPEGGEVSIAPRPPQDSFMEAYTLSYLVPPISPFYSIVRQEALDTLTKAIETSFCVIVRAEEPLKFKTGKTELALAYCQQAKKIYAKVIWLRGDKRWLSNKVCRSWPQEVIDALG